MALSALVGWERSTAGRPAGLRTHMLVGAAAALVGAGEGVSERFRAEGSGGKVDPLRIIEAIVAGSASSARVRSYSDRGPAASRGSPPQRLCSLPPPSASVWRPPS